MCWGYRFCVFRGLERGGVDVLCRCLLCRCLCPGWCTPSGLCRRRGWCTPASSPAIVVLRGADHLHLCELQARADFINFEVYAGSLLSLIVGELALPELPYRDHLAAFGERVGYVFCALSDHGAVQPECFTVYPLVCVAVVCAGCCCEPE